MNYWKKSGIIKYVIILLTGGWLTVGAFYLFTGYSSLFAMGLVCMVPSTFAGGIAVGQEVEKLKPV